MSIIYSYLSLAFSHNDGDDAEAEYDRLRDLARREADKKKGCFDRVCLPFSPSCPFFLLRGEELTCRG